jgi:hypothetical protein
VEERAARAKEEAAFDQNERSRSGCTTTTLLPLYPFRSLRCAKQTLLFVVSILEQREEKVVASSVRVQRANRVAYNEREKEGSSRTRGESNGEQRVKGAREKCEERRGI